MPGMHRASVRLQWFDFVAVIEPRRRGIEMDDLNSRNLGHHHADTLRIVRDLPVDRRTQVAGLEGGEWGVMA